MSFQETLWNFLNSGIGLLVAGFFLTTLAGTFLTTWYKRESKKDEVRFVQLHEDRAKAIKTFHDKTVELKKTLEDLKIIWGPGGVYPPEPISEDVNQKVEAYRTLSEEYKIYFGKELRDLIDGIGVGYASIFDFAENIGIILRSQARDLVLSEDLSQEEKERFGLLNNGKQTITKAREHIDSFSDILGKILEELRVEFRNILGVK